MSRGGLAAVFVVFAFLGPIFGGVIFGLMLSLRLALESPGMAATLPMLGVLVLLPVSYLNGGLQAMAAGSVAVWAGWRAGRLSWPLPLCAAAAMGLVAGALHHAEDEAGIAAIIVVAHVGAAVLCLAMCRLMFGRPAATAA